MALDCLEPISVACGIDMNERIQQLAEQCGFRSNPNIYDRNQSFDIEKFAELIVRDCIDCVDGYTKPRTFGTHYDAVEQIKANFGIE